MGVRPAQHTGSVRIDCDRCGGHACPHAYRLAIGSIVYRLCGTCLETVSQLLLSHHPKSAQSLARGWMRLREG